MFNIFVPLMNYYKPTMEFPVDFAPSDGTQILTERSVITWLEDDHCKIYALPGIKHEIEDAKKQIDFFVENLSDKEVNIILDLRNALPISLEVRNYYAASEDVIKTRKRAIIINSAFTKIIANFYMGFRKSGFKSKLFTSVEDAENWIRRKP